MITDSISTAAPVLLPEVGLYVINRPAHSSAAAGTGQGRTHYTLLRLLK